MKEEQVSFTKAPLILLILIFLMLLTFVYDGICAHLLDMARTYDYQEVTEAITAATVAEVHAFPKDKVYYYDSATKQVYTMDQIQKDGIVIKGYGRTVESGNRKKETGARGIPNTGFNPTLISRLFHTGTPDGSGVLEIRFREDGTLDEAVWTML